MNGPTRRGGAVAAWIAVSLLLAGSAWGQNPDCVGVEIQPARFARDGAAENTYQVVVRNCTTESLRITLSVSDLGHDLDGAPEFFESTEAEQALRLSDAGAFTLKAGKAKTVKATGTIPSGQRSLYAGVVAEFERIDVPSATSVETRSRVAGMLLMRGPKPWKQTARVTDIGVSPNGDGSYTVHAAVEDTGDVHINPKGTMHIVKDGTALDSVRLTGGTILPGYKRRLTGRWTPSSDLGGRVRLNAEITDPSASGSTEIDFSEGEALAPAARITSLIASDADGAYLAVSLLNSGPIDIAPNIEVVITEGQFERARMNFPQSEPMQPGDERTVEWEPELPDGTYRVTARALQGQELLDEKVTGLRIGAAPALPDDKGGLPWWVIVIASMLLVTVLAGLLFVVARRRRDDEDPPAAGPVAPSSARELAGTAGR